MRWTLLFFCLVIGCNDAPPQQSSSVVNEPIPIIISSDSGVEVDDLWTIAHAALTPSLDLKGVVAVHGPVIVDVDEKGHISGQKAPPDTVSRAMAAIARNMLNALPLQEKPPVYEGANRPMADITSPVASRGADFILKTSGEFDTENRLTILMLGPATDVAAAILTDPTVVDRIKVVAMAYNHWPQGTDEFNVHNDIPAWQVLMHSKTPLVVGDSTVTATHLKMTRHSAESLFGDKGASGSYLAEMLISWLDNNGRIAESVVGDADEWPMWDEVTVAYVLGLTEQQTYPRPRLRDDMTFDHNDADHPGTEITWVTRIDEGALWTDFAVSLENAINEQRP